MQPANDHLRIFESLLRPDRTGVPKYMRLTNALAEAITSGYWKAGDRLPTEEELAEMTPFSLGTVQRALRNLVDQGIVVRQHGLGSFVAENEPRLEDPWHCRFLDDDGETFLPVYSRVLVREAATGRGEWSRYFPAADGHVARIDRAISVNNEFTVLTRFFYDSRKLPGLSDARLKELDGLNFKTLIADELSVPITRIAHDVRVEYFNEAVAKVIGVKAGDVGIFLRAAAHMGETACVYYQEFFIPATQRRLSIPDQLPSTFRKSR